MRSYLRFITAAVIIVMIATLSTIANRVSAANITCGVKPTLSLEAEEAQLSGAFTTINVASGGQAIEVPNGTGNSFSIPNEHEAQFTFEVTTAGTYRVDGCLYADGWADDSFYAIVEGTTYLWETGTYDTWHVDPVNDRDSAAIAEIEIPAGGTLTVSVYLRQDGTQLDWLGLTLVQAAEPTLTAEPTSTPEPTTPLEPTETVDPTPETPQPSPTLGSGPGGACAANPDIYIEGEDAVLSGSFGVLDAAQTSGGQAIEVANGTGNSFSTPNEHKALFTFDVATAGTYRVDGCLYADGWADDSFYAVVDGTTYLWETGSYDIWHLDPVNDRDSGAVAEVEVPAGATLSVSIYLRQDGVQLDWLGLTLLQISEPTATIEPTPTEAPTVTAEPTETVEPSPTVEPTQTPEPSATPDTSALVVDSTGDASDEILSDGVCATGSGTCTLRAAIQQANHNENPVNISFELGDGTHTISLDTPLPSITVPVLLSGPSGDVPSVIIDGAGVSANGIVLEAGAEGSVVAYLGVVNFQWDGVMLRADSVTVQGCFIGLSPDGTTAQGNNNGLSIDGTANHTVRDNVIAGNRNDGIVAWGTGVQNNLFSGNYIGVNAAGDAAAPNGGDGVHLKGGSSNTFENNVIAGNQVDGMVVSARANTFTGNYIGVNATGDAALPNGDDGIQLGNAAENTIGTGNIISGNSRYGIIAWGSGTHSNLIQGNLIGTDVTSTEAIPNGIDGLRFFSSVGPNNHIDANVLSSNPQMGIRVSNDGTLITANYIGVDASGQLNLGNGINGIALVGAADTIVRYNLISGNGNDGIYSFAAPNPLIENNVIGLSANEESRITNLGSGIALFENDQVATITGNIISASGHRSIYIGDSFAPVEITANILGTNRDSAPGLGNHTDGVYLSNVTQVMIGGANPGEGNHIAGNGESGILIEKSDGNVLILGNVIGISADGTAALPNDKHGIFLVDAQNVTIGALDAPNLIAANGEDGISLKGASSGNFIRFNQIDMNAKMGIYHNLSDAPPVPTVLSATVDGAQVMVEVEIQAQPETTYEVDVYASPQPDGSGYGEGRFCLGAVTLNTDSTGYVSFEAVFDLPSERPLWVTATATGPDGTSGFAFSFEAYSQ